MENNRELRGWILRVIDKAFPDPLSVTIVRDQLLALGFAPDNLGMKANLAYLEEKEYIHKETAKAGGIERETIRLTARGKDLLEGNIPDDPGIQLGARFG
ncbi:hypothetical protein [Brevibacillus sp. SYSU BS000544]|uniref:hypothetical protein n=1 Tax=Brevibacillus sp. SYSU BS000544 TaxID=3416443 RepID=UPI003CE44A33